MSTTVRTEAASLRVFLEHMIDYAGLFPPASLDMKTCVENYARYREQTQNWALGRFVLPVSRLNEFSKEREMDIAASGPWKLSAIVSANIEADLAAVSEFNNTQRRAVIDSIEIRVGTADQMERARANLPLALQGFYEIPAEHAGELLPALRHLRDDASRSIAAKLRSGGVMECDIPSVEEVSGFIAQCAELRVPFKATAGLHHPLRSLQPLTYESNSPRETMHGFLNVFTAAAIAWSAVQSNQAVSRSTIATCLADEDRANWHLGEEALTWLGDEEPVRIDLECLASMRNNFALGFGSCSFEEPLSGLHEFNLL